MLPDPKSFHLGSGNNIFKGHIVAPELVIISSARFIPSIPIPSGIKPFYKQDNAINQKNLIVPDITRNQSISASISHINVRSIVNKTSSFHDYISDMSPTICALMETWLPNDETDLRYKEVPPKGYDIISGPHPTHQKGWWSSSHLQIQSQCQSSPPTTNISEVMEHLDLTINFKGLVVNLYVIYRFPNTSVIQFCDGLSDLLEEKHSQ